MQRSALVSLYKNNHDFRAWLADFAGVSAGWLCLEDQHGHIIYGDERARTCPQYEIYLAGEKLGSVFARKQGALIHQSIQIFLKQDLARRKLGTETLQMYREINLLFSFSEKLSRITRAEEISHLALEQLSAIIPFDTAVAIADWGDNNDFSVMSLRGNDLPFERLDRSLLRDQAGITEIELDPVRYSLLFAPLKVNDRLLGHILLFRDHGKEFSSPDLKLLTSLAFQTGSALENALHYKLMVDKEIELREEKLQRENLAQLNQMKSQFFLDLAHEFRTPLTVILGMTENAGANEAVAPHQRFSMIHRNASTMLELINQMLDLSRRQEISVPVMLVERDIVAFLKKMMEPYQWYAADQKKNIVFNNSIDKLVTKFDAEKIQRIVANLISNAIKFIEPGGQIIVDVNYIEGKERPFVLTVEDNGRGIPEKDLDRIFDRFYQAENTLTGPIPGTGIGLAQVRDLAELLGGEIQVSSVVGKGSVFTLFFPLERIPQGPVDIVFEEGDSAESLIEAEKPTLLIIEDNPDLVVYVEEKLGENYSIISAPDGSIGIAKARQVIPDLIITDLMLPVTDGIEVCRALKSDERTNHIPLIILTARMDRMSKIEGLRQGVDGFLTKPFDLDELKIRLEMLLENRRKLQTYFNSSLNEDPEKEIDIPLEYEHAFVKKLCLILDENLSDETFGLPELCRQIGMSRSQLFRKLKALINQSPSVFIRMYRLRKAKRLLETTDLPVSQIAYQVGFKDPAYFSFAFHEAFGCTPTAVR